MKTTRIFVDDLMVLHKTEYTDMFIEFLNCYNTSENYEGYIDIFDLAEGLNNGHFDIEIDETLGVHIFGIYIDSLTPEQWEKVKKSALENSIKF